MPPSQPILPAGITIPVELNKPINVTCQALNGKPRAQITWKKDGLRVTENTYEKATVQPDGKRVDTEGNVTITAEISDAGKRLECGAWNEALGDEEPYWTQATLDVTCKIGNIVKLFLCQCCLLITLNSLDPDQAQQNVDPDLDPNSLIV